MNEDPVPVPIGSLLSPKVFWLLLFAPLLWPLTLLIHGFIPPAVTPPSVQFKPPAQPHYRHETVFKPVPEFARFHAATLTQAPNGDLLAACRGDRPGATRSSWGMSAVILFSRKSPGAEKWSPPIAISVTPDRMDTNPVLWTDPVFGGPQGNGGRIWLFHGTSFGVGWQFSRLSYRYSDDFGHTWSDRRPLTGIENLNTRCPPVSVPLPDGSRQIALPVYREFGQSFCLISNDHGESWTPSEPIVSGILGNFQPSLLLNADNSVNAFMRASGMQQVLYAHSSDGGRHWSPVQPLALNNPFTSVAAAQSSSAGTALVFNNTQQAERFHLSVALRLADGSCPWFSAPREIVPEADRDRQQEYPAVLATADGRFHIAYTLGRNRIDLIECNADWILQNDTGAVAGGPAPVGWRGIPGLVALLLFYAGVGLLRWLGGRWVRLNPAQTWAAVSGQFQLLVLLAEALLLLLLLALGPRGVTLGDWLILTADNFLSGLAAMILTAWIALAGCLLWALWRLRASFTAVAADLLWLAGLLAFGTVTAGYLIWPPVDLGYGAVTPDHAFPANTANLEALRHDYRAEYRLQERTALEAGPDDPPEKILERFMQLRTHLDTTFAASRGLTSAQLAALSPYHTGEQFIAPPPLQTNAPLFIRATTWALPCWLVALLLTLLKRRRKNT